MNYLITNLIVVALLMVIYLAMNHNSDGLFYMLAYVALKLYVLILCPIIIAFIDMVFIIATGRYDYILFVLIPLMLPIITVIYEKTEESKYHNKYNKYNTKVCEITSDFLKANNINLTDSYIGTSYGNNTFSEESKGKLQCRANITINDKNIDNLYKLTKDVEQHLKTSIPTVYFTARIDNKAISIHDKF